MVACGVFGTGEIVAPTLPRNISISGKGGIRTLEGALHPLPA